MKTLKFILPAAAFLFAIAGMFASNASTTDALASQEFYFDASSVCQEVPTLSCNNITGFVCKFKPAGDIYRDVYESRVTVQGETTCQTVIQHSLNGGALN